jgi:hypothetical protein
MSMGYWELSRGAKRQGREADHSCPYSAEANAWSSTTTPSIYLHGVVQINHSKNINITFSRDISVDIVTRLSAKRPRNRGSIPGMSEGFFFSPHRPGWTWPERLFHRE